MPSFITKKKAARLLSIAILENKIQRYGDWKNIIHLLDSNNRIIYYNKYIKKLSNCGLDNHDLLSWYLINLYPDSFSHIIRNNENIPLWNVFGCPNTGRDYDVIVMVTDATLPLYPGEEEKFLFEFKSIKKYNEEKPIDICYVSNNNGTFQTNHGGQETINIVYHSYAWHYQVHPPFFSCCDLVHVNGIDKLSTISKFLMDKLESLVPKTKYLSLRDEKKRSYLDGEKKFIFTFKIFDLISIDSSSEFWNDKFWKSLVMKICQCYLCINNPKYHKENFPYNKILLADEFSKFFPTFGNEIKKILLYKYEGNNLELKIFLKILYILLYNTYYPKINKQSIFVDLKKNSTSLSNELLNSFINSPKVMTDEFYNLWYKTYNKKDISSVFIEPCQNINLFKNFNSIRERILFCSQRSPEWHNAYRNKYKTGRSNGLKQIFDNDTHKDIISKYYNLIMGCVGEQLIHQTLQDNLPNIFPFKEIGTIGMIVEGGDGSRGYCPDGIAKTFDDKLVPLEYKTIYSNSKRGISLNNGFMREYNLARKQLKGAVNALNVDQNPPISNAGLIVFLFITPNQNYKNCQDNQDICPYNFTIKWNKIEFEGYEKYFDK